MAKSVSVNQTIVFTRDYEDGWFKGDRTIRQGTRVMVTRVHRGLLGDTTHLDVRLPDGARIREVEFDYFSA